MSERRPPSDDLDAGVRGEPGARGEPGGPGASRATLPVPADPADLATDPRRLAAVLATVLDQQSRDASANRAQARELIRAVEGLAQAHEFLGVELRGERGRSRALLGAVVLVLVLGIGAGAWVAWNDDGREERLAAVEASLRDVRNRNDAERIAALRSDYESRLGAASDDAASLRDDLEATRAALAAERRVREANEADLATKLAVAERERGELTGVRAELASVRDLAGAEKARADDLTRALTEAVRATGLRAAEPAPSDAPGEVPAARDGRAAPANPSGAAPVGRAAPVTSVPPAAVAAPRSADPPTAASPAAPPPTASPQTAPQTPPSAGPRPAPEPAPAVRDTADLDRIRTRLNSLLEGTTGAARYRIERLAGVSGTDLLELQVVGEDEGGRTLRTIEAGRGQIVVSSQGSIRFRFHDGHLLVGGRKAPFFDGSYSLTLDGAADPWRTSGLTCVRLE